MMEKFLKFEGTLYPFNELAEDPHCLAETTILTSSQPELERESQKARYLKQLGGAYFIPIVKILTEKTSLHIIYEGVGLGVTQFV